jgi:elongation factor Ts
MSVSIHEIRNLREKTGAGVMDCKEALINSNNNIEKAIIYLRKKGLSDIINRSSRTTSEGTIGYYIHAGNKIGVIVEINCETDFVAKSDEFQKFAKEVAMHIAATNPRWISREQIPQDIIEQEKEIIKFTILNKPQHIVDKIMVGKLNKFFKEVCLMEQKYIKDDNLNITDLFSNLINKVGENIVIRRFSRFIVGEDK